MAIGSMTTNSTVDMIDKTLKTENAPADAAAVGNIILDPDGNAIFYSKAEVEAKIKEILAAQREEDYARVRYWVSDDPTSPASFIGGTWERVENCTIWGASSLHPAGTTLEAGLPNITGHFNSRPHMTGNYGTGGSITHADGKLFVHSPQASSDQADSSMTETDKIYKDDLVSFNASRFNPIYGASDTVQPPAYCTYIWRRVD